MLRLDLRGREREPEMEEELERRLRRRDLLRLRLLRFNDFDLLSERTTRARPRSGDALRTRLGRLPLPAETDSLRGAMYILSMII